MQQNNDLHIYIPRVESYHTEEYIRNALAYELIIDRIDFFPRQNEKGQKYNGALIFVKEWYGALFIDGKKCEMGKYSKLYLTLQNGQEYKFNHSPKYFWVLTKHTIAPEAKSALTEEEEQKINENTHVYIVRAEHNHNEEYIMKAFNEIAIISQITFVPKKNEKGQTYNGVVLLIREWINKTNGMLDTLNEGKEYRHNHSPKYHWLMTRHRIDWTPESLVDKIMEETIDKIIETGDV
jgi:hypothetical protein